MKDGSRAHVVAHIGVPVFEEFLCEGHATLSTADAGEGVELTEGEVTRMRRDQIEKTGLWFRVPESGNALDVILRQFHNERISAVNSRWSKILRSFEASSAWA